MDKYYTKLNTRWIHFLLLTPEIKDKLKREWNFSPFRIKSSRDLTVILKI